MTDDNGQRAPTAKHKFRKLSIENSIDTRWQPVEPQSLDGSMLQFRNQVRRERL